MERSSSNGAGKRAASKGEAARESDGAEIIKSMKNSESKRNFKVKCLKIDLYNQAN